MSRVSVDHIFLHSPTDGDGPWGVQPSVTVIANDWLRPPVGGGAGSFQGVKPWGRKQALGPPQGTTL